jgi:hypothetical protein
MPKKQAVPEHLPQRGAKESDSAYITRVFKALYGTTQKRVKPLKPKQVSGNG